MSGLRRTGERVVFYGIMMETLAGLAVLLTPAALVAAGLLARSDVRGWLRRRRGTKRAALAGALVVAVVATAGSLYLSEVVGFPPCRLCWIQRGAMYPLVPLLGLALVRGGTYLARLSLPLSTGGFSVAVYHAVIQLQPSLDVVTCQADAPCTSRWVAVFGFVSIPWLAGSAFVLVTVLLLIAVVASLSPQKQVAASS